MTRPFASLFAVMPGQDVRKTAIAATKAGYAVVPVEPGGKRPVCTLNTRERAAAGAGHRCGVHHYITDPAVADRVFKRLDKYDGEHINLGVVAGPSRLIVVDADNYAGVMAFAWDMVDGMDDAAYVGYSPTVRTPGVKEEGDKWRHKDGGHFYFNLPDGVDLGWEVTGTIVDPSGYDIRWGMSQTLVPPSTRVEGGYQAMSDMPDAPEWLLTRIRNHIAGVITRRTERQSRGTHDGVSAWASEITWEELLTHYGWSDSGKPDKCGCTIWTKPGGGTTSFKSATAHEDTCPEWDNDEGHGPLHMWTTEPPAELMKYVEAGQQTITKLQFVAAMEHAGDVSAAMTALGIGTIGSDQLEWLNHLGDEPEKGESQSPPLDMGISETGTSGFWVGEDDGVEDLIVERSKQLYVNRRASEYLSHRTGMDGPELTVLSSIELDDDADPIAPSVSPRSDGVDLLYRGRVNTIFGPSEAGKSWFTLACVLSTVRAGGRAMVVDMEDDQAGFKARLKTVGTTAAEAQSISYIRPWSMITTSMRAEILERAKDTDLIVVDSLDAYCALQGMDSNHAISIREAGSWLKSIAIAADTAVLLVDHSSEKGEGPAKLQMGSSAKKQHIDGSTFRADRLTLWRPGPEKCRTMIMAGKDRHGWAKAHAHFRNPTAEWGRMVELTMQATVTDKGEWVSELRLAVPPTFEEVSGNSESELLSVEDRIIDFLRAQPPEKWHTRTAVYTAAGDKNGRSPVIVEALARLVEQKVIEHQLAQFRNGRTGDEYRFSRLDDKEK